MERAFKGRVLAVRLAGCADPARARADGHFHGGSCWVRFERAAAAGAASRAGEIDLGGRLAKICLSRMKAPDPLAGDRPGRGAVFARLRDATTLAAVDGVVAELRLLLDAREYTLVFAALGRVRADGRGLPLLDEARRAGRADGICCHAAIAAEQCVVIGMQSTGESAMNEWLESSAGPGGDNLLRYMACVVWRVAHQDVQ